MTDERERSCDFFCACSDAMEILGPDHFVLQSGHCFQFGDWLLACALKRNFGSDGQTESDTGPWSFQTGLRASHIPGHGEAELRPCESVTFDTILRVKRTSGHGWETDSDDAAEFFDPCELDACDTSC